jgi:hypothetical protein
MKKLNVFLIIAAISTALLSCSQEDNNNNNNAPFTIGNLEGTWDLKVLKWVDVTNDQVVLENNNVPSGMIYFTFKSNGKYDFFSPDDTLIDGNYQIINSPSNILLLSSDTIDVTEFNPPNMTFNFKRIMNEPWDMLDSTYNIYYIMDLLKRP